MLLFFSDEVDETSAVLVKSGLVLAATVLLCASGWLWHRAKQRDVRTFYPEKAAAQSSGEVKRTMAIHVAAFFGAALLLVMLFFVWIANR